MRVPPKTILHMYIDASIHISCMYIMILGKKYFLIMFTTHPRKICWQVCYKSCSAMSLQWRMNQDLCQRWGNPAVRQGCCWSIDCKLMELLFAFSCLWSYAATRTTLSIVDMQTWCEMQYDYALPPSRHLGMAPPTPQNRPGVWTLLERMSGYLLMVFMFILWKLEVSARNSDIAFASWDSTQDMMSALFTLVQTKVPSSLSEDRDVPQVFNLAEAGHFEHLSLLVDKLVCH